MPQEPENKPRRLIPRWRHFSSTPSQELVSSRRSKPAKDNQQINSSLTGFEQHWAQEPTLENAIDLVNASLVEPLSDIDTVQAAAKFVINHPTAVDSAKIVAERLLTPRKMNSDQILNPEPASQRLPRQIGKVREKLRAHPRNPILQAELSRLYAALGQIRSALKSMHIAYSLAPSNRYILRSYSRLLVHCDDLERAKWVLSKVDERDPWLLAARLSVLHLAGVAPKHLRAERAVLTSDIEDSQITELAAAVATLELESGSVKKTKKYLNKAQNKPTDNSVAQLRWLSKVYSFSFDQRLLNIPLSYEARARHAMMNQNYTTALKECQFWSADEPFSTYPSSLGCYVAAEYLHDFETALDFAKVGIVANPDDPVLLNNLAFALAMLGKLDEASGALVKAKTNAHEEGKQKLLRATEGAIAFRKNQFEDGRKHYLAAVRDAYQANDPSAAARATIHALSEQVAVAPALAPEIERIRLIFHSIYKARGPDLFGNWVRKPVEQGATLDPTDHAEIQSWINALFEAPQKRLAKHP